MTNFKAFWVEKTDDGVAHSVIERSTDDLPEGELLVKVAYSSLNYKDAMSAKGLPGVTRNYPHTPGIDAAGVIVESTDSGFAESDEVIVIGYDLGMNTAGGYGQYQSTRELGRKNACRSRCPRSNDYRYRGFYCGIVCRQD